MTPSIRSQPLKQLTSVPILKTVISALCLPLLLFACAAEKASLVSVKERTERAPALSSEKYLTATGIGDSEKEARLNARAELAAIFESKVSSDVINRVKSVVEASGRETVTRDDERNIRVLSSVELEGVETGRTWYDEKQSAYYAVALLDRQKARESWQNEADLIDDEIELILASLDSKQSDFGRFQSLKKARQRWLGKEVTLSRLRVLGYSDTSVATYNIKDILSGIERLKSQFLIFISLDGADNRFTQIIRDEITKNLSREGYLLTEEKARGNLLIEATLKVTPVELNNPEWKFARAILNLSVVDKVSGLTVAEISENKRASHLTYDEAAHKAVKSVAKMSAEKIIEYFGYSR